MTSCRCCEALPAFAGMTMMLDFELKNDFEIGSRKAFRPETIDMALTDSLLSSGLKPLLR
jgi:hypothetical protein